MHVFSICLPLQGHTETLSRMNTVIYVNYREYFAQNKPALNFFIYVCLKMAGVVDDEFKRVR